MLMHCYFHLYAVVDSSFSSTLPLSFFLIQHTCSYEYMLGVFGQGSHAKRRHIRFPVRGLSLGTLLAWEQPTSAFCLFFCCLQSTSTFTAYTRSFHAPSQIRNLLSRCLRYIKNKLKGSFLRFKLPQSMG